MRFFYIVLAETRADLIQSIIQVIKKYNNILQNIEIGVLVRYTKWRARTCIPCVLAKKNNILVFIDNGAFTFLTSQDLEGKPKPETLAKWRRDYALWLIHNKNLYDYAALPDIPVHGKRFLEHEERLERIRLSTENQARMLALLPDNIKKKMIPVIQGYTVSEYEYSHKLLKEQGIPDQTAYSHNTLYKEILSVGSVCVRKWTARKNKIAEGKAAGSLKTFLKQLLNECCPETRGFHLFGLHTNAIHYYAHHKRYYSSDTGAHGFGYKYRWKELGCNKPNTPDCAKKIVDRKIRRSLEPFLNKKIIQYIE